MNAGRLLREAAISAMINAAISAGFYLALFHGLAAVSVAGVGGFAFDFVPQSFMVALMGALVPGLLALRPIAAAGLVVPARSRVVVQAFGFAVLAALIGAGIAASLPAYATIGFATGLLVKIAYGAALGAAVTALALRRLWHHA
jgi:hypothetical protein